MRSPPEVRRIARWIRENPEEAAAVGAIALFVAWWGYDLAVANKLIEPIQLGGNG